MDPVTWSFTTETPDTTKPTVTSRTPAAGATNVAVGTTVIGVFSEAVQQARSAFSCATPAATGRRHHGVQRRHAHGHADPDRGPGDLDDVHRDAERGHGLAGNVMDPVTWSFTTEAAGHDEADGDQPDPGGRSHRRGGRHDGRRRCSARR